MNGRMTLETLTISAVVIAGLIGLIAAVHSRTEHPAVIEFDEINESPIGI